MKYSRNFKKELSNPNGCDFYELYWFYRTYGIGQSFLVYLIETHNVDAIISIIYSIRSKEKYEGEISYDLVHLAITLGRIEVIIDVLPYMDNHFVLRHSNAIVKAGREKYFSHGMDKYLRKLASMHKPFLVEMSSKIF